jgi:hypothetical protein
MVDNSQLIREDYIQGCAEKCVMKENNVAGPSPGIQIKVR